MSKEKERAHELLLESPEGIARLLKSAAHPARMKILALLAQEERDFSSLLRQSGLSKNALVNHLERMMENGLVRRESRGRYALTEDGRELVAAAADVYRGSVRRREDQKDRLRMLYDPGYSGGGGMMHKLVGNAGVYQPCWLSFTGAVAGCLKALGIECDTVDVGGMSGYSFLINVAKGRTCPSGPTAMPSETWEEVRKGVGNLGFELGHWEDNASYPSVPGSPTPEEIKKAEKLFEMVRKEIDRIDRPVVLWGLGAPEYGIVNGYDNKSYIVSTFRGLIGQPDDPVLYYDLKATGCMDLVWFGDRIKIDEKGALNDALVRALRFARGEMPKCRGYDSGPAALTEWARVLESGEGREYFGNSYVGACVAESREMCTEFMSRMSRKFEGERSRDLSEASKHYARGAKLMGQFTKLFPFAFEGEMKQADCKKGAEILRNVRRAEEKAIECIERAIES